MIPACLARLLALPLLLIALWSAALAAPPKPLPTATVVESPLATADDGIAEIHVSQTFPTDLPKVKPGSDLIQVVVDEIRDFSRRSGRFADLPDGTRLSIQGVFYEIGDPRVTDALIEAQRNGVERIQVVTDLNVSLAIAEPGVKRSSRFEEATYRDSPMATELKRLREAGFRYNDPKFGITSQPLNDGQGIQPIMHEKSLYLVATLPSGEKRYFTIVTTSNMVNNLRYNRLLKITDQDVGRYGSEHADRMTEAFAKGGEITDIESQPPLRVRYKDGTQAEMAFTDGKFNPNDRITDRIREGLRTPGDGWELRHVLLSHFVFTNKKTADALADAMKQFPELDLVGLFGDKFATSRGFGQVATFDGFTVYTPFGRILFSRGRDIAKRSQLYVLQQEAPGRVETELDGAPVNRGEHHDKTTFLHWVKKHLDGKLPTEHVYDVFFGSLNLSAHSDNAEVQLWYSVGRDSVLARSTWESVHAFMEAHPDLVLPLNQYIVREALARMIGHRDLEIPVPELRKIMDLVEAGELRAAREVVEGLIDLPTTLANPLKPAAARSRIKDFFSVLEWKATLPPVNPKDPRPFRMSISQLVSLATVVAYPDLAYGQIRSALGSAFWEPGIDDAELNKRIDLAYARLSIEKVLPGGMSREPDARAPAPAAGEDAPEVASEVGAPVDADAPAAKPGTAKPEDPKAAANAAAEQAMATLSAPRQILEWNFDLDDNVFNLPTKIILFEKGTGKELAISTGEYARAKRAVGVGSDDPELAKYAGYEVRLDPMTGSFRNFRDPEGRNLFLEDLKSSVEGQAASVWQGPSFEAFVQALSTPESAAHAGIITARGQAPEKILEGLRYLQAKGYIRNLPALERIATVGNRSVSDSASPSEAKTRYMIQWLDELNAKPLPADAPLVLSADGKRRERLHLWGFSDDDEDNIRKAVETLSPLVKAGRWKNVKITLFYTQPRKLVIGPRAIVLTPAGNYRASRPEECLEYPMPADGASKPCVVPFQTVSDREQAAPVARIRPKRPPRKGAGKAEPPEPPTVAPGEAARPAA